MYARRAAVLCNGECTPRDGLAPVRKRKGGGSRACRARRVRRAVFVALAAKATFEGD